MNSMLCDAQELINGDFENHPFEECTYNLSDEAFNNSVPNIFGFGKAFIAGENVGELDLQTFDCYVEPASGSWCIGLSADTSSFSDAIAIELSSPLEIGEKYDLSFSHYSSSTNLTPVEIGVSNAPDNFGSSLGIYTTAFEQWTADMVTFMATENSKYITIRAVAGDFGWAQVDAFSIVPMGTAVEENDLSLSRVYPNPTSNLVHIEFGKIFKSISLTISDVLGNIYIQNDYSNVNELKLDLSKLNNGTYILELRSIAGRQSFPIIKF